MLRRTIAAYTTTVDRAVLFPPKTGFLCHSVGQAATAVRWNPKMTLSAMMVAFGPG
jgi:hypothetical protein